MRIIKFIGNLLYGFLIAVVVVIITAMVMTTQNITDAYRLFIVQSGSMEPAIKTGSVVLVEKSNNYTVGDVITYSENVDGNISVNKSTYTHRLVSVKVDGNTSLYQTKGDANRGEDVHLVNEKQILGRVIVTIPWLGYIVAFSRTRIGLLCLIIIPAVVIIYHELINIKTEINKMVKKRKDPAIETEPLP
jgi:signal peptidase I